MKRSILIGLLVLVIILLANTFFIVTETEQVIITQFGKPVGDAIREAGMYSKIPFIQKVHSFEKRILEWDGDSQEIPIKKKYIQIDTFARWRISDPLFFYKSVRQEPFAHSLLDDIISGKTRDIVAQYELIEIVRNSQRGMEFVDEDIPEEFLFDEKMGGNDQDSDAASFETMGKRRVIAGKILEESRPAMEQYGIELIDVRFKRVNYTPSVRQDVYDRMISERKKIANLLRSIGQMEAKRIEGERERKLQEIESNAYREAQGIKGRADSLATRYYAEAYRQDPDFFQFMRTLEAYRKTIDSKNTLILSTDSDYFRFLKEE